jgi:hypothetical protein
MKLHLPSKKFIVSSFSLLVAIAVLLTVVPAVSAEGEGPLTPIPGLGRLPNATIVRMHKLEIGWYNDQTALIKKADQLGVKFAALIKSESSEGKDVTILQTALDTFTAEVAATREIHAVAATAIFTAVGYRVDGNVKDRIVAGQSLLDGRDSLKEANFRLNQAMADLEKGFIKWRHYRVGDPHYSYHY